MVVLRTVVILFGRRNAIHHSRFRSPRGPDIHRPSTVSHHWHSPPVAVIDSIPSWSRPVSWDSWCTNGTWPYFGPLGRSLATWRDNTPRPAPDCAMANRNNGNIAIQLGAAGPVFYAPAYCIQCRWSRLRTIPIVVGRQFDTDSSDLWYVKKMCVCPNQQQHARENHTIPHVTHTLFCQRPKTTYRHHFVRPTVSRVTVTTTTWSVGPSWVVGAGYHYYYGSDGGGTAAAAGSGDSVVVVVVVVGMYDSQ